MMWNYAVMAAVAFVLLFLLFQWARRSAAKNLDSARHSDYRDAVVVNVEQVSAPNEGGEPMLKLHLRFPETGGAERFAELTEFIDYANIPRPGDAVVVSADRRDVSRMKYRGLKANQNQAAVFPIDYFDLQRRGIRTATVASVKNEGPPQKNQARLGGFGPMVLEVVLDSITEPERRVTFQQRTLDYVPVRAERIYVFVSRAGDPVRGGSEEVTAVPLQLTGGLRRSRAENRLDRLVLGPAIRNEGKQAHGTVLEAKEVWTGSAYQRDSGVRRFQMRFRVAPLDNGPVYETEQEMAFSNEELIQRICRVGVSVPLRCDWNDPKTVVTDGGALGYPDPYPLAIERWNEAVRNGTADKL